MLLGKLKIWIVFEHEEAYDSISSILGFLLMQQSVRTAYLERKWVERRPQQSNRNRIVLISQTPK